MENEKVSSNKHTPIQYLLHEQESPTTTSDFSAGFSRLEVRALQVPLEGSTYDTNNNYLYLKLFQSKNLSVSGPYVKKSYRTKYG